MMWKALGRRCSKRRWGGLPVEQAPAGCLRVTGVRPHDVLRAWEAARTALPITGRWPVFRSNDFGELDRLAGARRWTSPRSTGPRDRSTLVGRQYGLA
jgi:hypothetical protein